MEPVRKKFKTIDASNNAELKENIEDKYQSEMYQHIKEAKSFDEQVWSTVGKYT